MDVAVEREDWDLAAALSEGMKQAKDTLYVKPEQREWRQTELDRFISENDWDAVSKYIAHMRDHPAASASRSSPLPKLSSPKSRDSSAGVDPEGFTAGTSKDVAPSTSKNESSPASQQQQQQELNTSAVSDSSSPSNDGKPATRFGARSQLQHRELNSLSSWENSSSSYESEYTDGSYESEEDQGYISLRVKRNEFAC